MSFDNLIAPKLAENQPKATHPGTGKRSDIVNYVLYQNIKGDNNKPHTNVRFKGLVVYTTTISLDELKKKYDSAFVEYCTKASPNVQSDDKIADLRIIECIVYIQELCACLPQPKDTDKFFEVMIKKNTKPKKGEETKKLREEDKSPGLSVKDMLQIERYPRAYMVLKNDAEEVKMQTIVDVQFPYNFDFSYGVIAGVSPR